MPSVGYVSASPWWSAARLNELCGEFDRRLTKALAGKTPYLLAKYGAGYEPDLALPRKFKLPIAQTTSDAVVEGVLAPFGTMGAVYCFKGEAADVVYFERTNAFDQSAMDTAAAAATEVSRDAGAKTMVVDDTAADLSLEWSLKALTRTADGTTFWLVPESTGSVRAMRKHRYAVAEIVLEGLSEFTIPRDWDRFSCFRIHNLSALEVEVTVETYAEDGSDGADETITLDKFGCRSFRREAGYYNADWNYCWKARAGKDKRFYKPQGAVVVELSAHANNFANPNIIKEWMEKLGALRDPYVDPPNEYPRYSSIFGNPSSSSTKIHDLIVHDGACKSIGWDASNNPIETAGTVGNSSSIVANLAALGITVSVVGDTYLLERNDATAEGEDSKGSDLFCSGSNLLWVDAGTVTVPGGGSFSQPERQRQYHTLPVTLMEEVPVGTLVNPGFTGYSSAGSTSALITRTLYGSSSTYGIGPKYAGTIFGTNDYTVNRLETLASADDGAAGSHSTFESWILTPLGFACRWNYSFTFNSGIPNIDSSNFEPLNGGIYQRFDGTTIQRKAWIHIMAPGWSFGSLKPMRNRVYGKHVHDADGFWATEDWSGEASDPDGNEPTATGKVLLEYPELKYLSDGTSVYPGDVYEVPLSSAEDRTETRYGVMVESDEARSVVDDLVASRRVQFNQGTPTVEAGSYPDRYYHRRPMQIEDFNVLAWMVNAWTRTSPLITIKLLWLKRTNDDGWPGLYIPDFDWDIPGPTGAEVFELLPPKDCAWGRAVSDPVSAWSRANWAAILDIEDREDIPNWAGGKANYKKYNTLTFTTSIMWKDGYSAPNPGLPDLFDVWQKKHFTYSGVSYVTHGPTITDSCFDYSDTDTGCYWVRTSSVQTLATAKGLPYLHLMLGQARKLWSREPDTTISSTEIVDANFSATQVAVEDPDTSDTSGGSSSSSVDTPDATVAYYTPAEEGDFESIEGWPYQVDANGIPSFRYLVQHRGEPTSFGNPITSKPEPSWVGEEPYYSDEEALSFSGSIEALGANLILSGYTDGHINSHAILGTQFTRAASQFNCVSGAVTGGSWTFNGEMQVVPLATGITFLLPEPVTESTVWVVCDPYVDLSV